MVSVSEQLAYKLAFFSPMSLSLNSVIKIVNPLKAKAMSPILS